MTHRPLLFVTAALSAIVPVGNAFADTSEAQKQATRLISQAISSRIGSTTDLDAGTAGDLTGSSRWALGSYSTFEVEGADLESHFALGSYGWDRGSGNTIGGISISGSFGAIENGFDTDFYGLAITPYGAIKVNDNFFWSGLIGYGVAFSDDGTDDRTDSSLFGELAANVVTRSDSATWRGKIGYRPSLAMPEEGDEDFFSTAVVFGEVEFNTGENSAIYFNAEANFMLDDDTGNDDTPVYVGTGFLFDNSDNSQWGFGYQTVVGADELTIHTLMLQGRWRF